MFDYFERSNIDRTFEKRMDFTFVGGPSYSSTTNLSLGLLAAGLYRTDRSDSLASRSDISLFANVSISGYYYVGISGNTFFNRDRHRLEFETGFRSRPSLWWGTGYEAAVNNAAATLTSKRYAADIRYKYRLAGRFHAGVSVGFDSSRAYRLSRPEYLDGERGEYTAAELGIFAEYDSRDVVTQPFRGCCVSVAGVVLPSWMSNCGRTLWRAEITAAGYLPVWRGGVLAAEFYGRFSSRGTPWSLNSQLGGGMRMRGYYEGRFNDLNMIEMQLEWRQRIWRRIGCVLWAGAGNVFGTDGLMLRRTLPNYGAGLRWELKKRMNIRVDCGFGKKIAGRRINGFIMSLNEAF
ncbi:MAG: BamA/TamA family outer membrane protein [Alistipes sp.]|nr:BamA/TamA family outer membrane protein [Alistipes sp.]